MMKQSDFWIYSEENEKVGGVYWEFAKASDEELKATDVYFEDVLEIIKRVKDSELKAALCKRMFDFFIKNGVKTMGGESLLTTDIFSTEQIRKLIEKEISTECINRLCKPDVKMSTINENVRLVFNSNDEQFIINQLLKIFKTINENNGIEDIKKINTGLIYGIWKRNPNIAQQIISRYREKISAEFFKFLEINNDANYLQRKAEKFKKEKIRIGIDPRISIGPEVEANNDFGIKFDVVDQVGYERHRVAMEATVPDGTEIVCHPFHDTPEEVANFCALLEAMKEMGFYYNEEDGNAAGQINIGLDYLNTPRSIMNFYEIFGNCEELLFHITNEEGQLTRQSVYVNSRFKAISEIIGTRSIDEDITREELLELFYVPHFSREEEKNISGLQYKKNTVGVRDLGSKEKERFEIRIPNGSTNYQTWIDNIRLFGKIIEMSRKLAEIEERGRTEELTDKEIELLGLKEELKDQRNTLEDKLFILMELSFEDDEIKQIYVNRFYTLQQIIRQTGTDRYSNKTYNSEPAFGIVDFENLYRSKSLVIKYDPETGDYSEDREESGSRDRRI